MGWVKIVSCFCNANTMAFSIAHPASGWIQYQQEVQHKQITSGFAGMITSNIWRGPQNILPLWTHPAKFSLVGRESDRGTHAITHARICVTSDQGQTRVRRKALNQSWQNRWIGIQNIIFIDLHKLFTLLVIGNYCTLRRVSMEVEKLNAQSAFCGIFRHWF